MSKVILITGANRGIGLAILQSLAQHPTTTSAIFLLGCRSSTQGEQAISELRAKNITSTIHALELDVASDQSVRAAVETVTKTYGRLDVLVNNAGYARIASAADFSDLRSVYADIYDVNVSSVAVLSALFLPLLRAGPASKLINVSSARASITRSATEQMPPTVALAYSVSKTALNILTVDLARQEDNKGVEFQLCSLGHCRTEFNGYRGTRDPVEGAIVVVELVVGPRRPCRLWETKGVDRELLEVPW